MLKKWLLSGVLLAVVVGGIAVSAALFGYVAHKEAWPAKIHSYLAGRTSACCVDEVREKLNINTASKSFGVVDAVRQFVHGNSVNADHDFGHDPHPYDTGGVIRALLEVSDGEREPMGLMCSSRSNAMTGILDQMAYQSRQVHVFAPKAGSHTFLEVKDASDGRWYIQDPDYNLFWINRLSGERLGLGEMLTTSRNDVLPCVSENVCDWKFAEPIRNYFGAGIYFNFDATPLIVVNEDRFDLDAQLPYTTPPGTIVEFAQRTWGADYGEPILSVVHGAP
ncbi:hypothetical protein [Thalassospira alkalitolerans]|uniref:hypothetical protein n=1 Tax=Thalassospira alkalitolerans TaxID=1293890 RepID=UPI003AA84ECA